MKPAHLIRLLFFFLFCLTGNLIYSQLSSSNVTGAQLNTIQTAVPFLTISPDSRASGMGDAGVASRADVNSQHWNVVSNSFRYFSLGEIVFTTTSGRQMGSYQPIEFAIDAGYSNLLYRRCRQNPHSCKYEIGRQI